MLSQTNAGQLAARRAGTLPRPASLPSQLAVCAGAGGGKTELLIATLVDRIMSAGLQPERCCVLTFTRSAGQELKERAAERAGDRVAEQLSRLRIGTLDAELPKLLDARVEPAPGRSVQKQVLYGWRLRLLQEQAVDRALELLNAGELDDLLALFHAAERDGAKAELVQTLVKHGEALRNAGVDLQRWALATSWSGRPEAYAGLLRSYLVNYQALKLARGCPVADSHDILESALKSECDIDLLLVDEAQDLTRIQLEACCHLARNGELVLVGDDAQRIYGFRHAGSSPLTALPQGASLVVNHRSARSIVTVANAMAVPGQLTQQHHRQSVGTVRRGVLPTDDDDTLARAITLLVGEEQSSVSPPATTAVLCRTNDEVRRVVKAARALSLPVRWNARRYLGKSTAVSALLNYTQGLMGATAGREARASMLGLLAGLEGESVGAPGRHEKLDVAVGEANGTARPANAFLRRHEELSEMSPGVPLGRRLRATVENLDLVTQLKERQADGIEADALLALLEVVEQERDDLTLDELRRLTQSGDPGGPEHDPRWRTQGIVILTVHDAKGLEWESVFLPYFLRRSGRPPGPVLVNPQSSTAVRVGIADLALDDGSRKVASRSDREAAQAGGRPLKRLRDPVYSELLGDTWARERADGLRLDYVAVTRARDRLTVVAADPRGRWPLELSHLHTAIAAAEQQHPGAVTRLTSPLTPPPPSATAAPPVPAVLRAVETPRPLVPPPLSPTRLERLLDGR